MKRITIKDIANELCLSVSTVSRALANDTSIRMETRKKVAETADRLGYRRNNLAASLRSGRSNNIAVIMTDMASHIQASILSGIQNVLHSKGMNMIVCNSNGNPECERRHLDMMDNANVDGMIISPCDRNDNNNLFRRLMDEKMPLVFIHNPPSESDVPKIIIQTYDKAFAITEHFILSGRKKTILLSSLSSHKEFNDITLAFRDAHRKHGLEVDENVIIPADFNISDGADIVQELVDHNIFFDGLFCAHGMFAFSAMNRLNSLGYNIPGDVAVAAVIGSQLSEYMFPSLTSVQIPLEKMGEEAAEMLMDIIENPDIPHRDIILDAEIKFRDSLPMNF